MKKIYLIIAGALLTLLIIISILLSLGKKSTTNTQKNFPFPTSILNQGSTNNQPSSNTDSQTVNNINQNLSNLPIDISTITPVETKDFKLQYSPKLNKIVIEKKTSQAEEQFINWASQNQLTRLIENPELTLIIEQGKNPDDLNPLLEFLNIFMNFGQGVGSSTQNPPSTFNLPSPTIPPQSPSSTLNPPSSTSNPQPNLTPNPNVSPYLTPSAFSGGKVYFAQCSSNYGNLSLPSGCDLCYAGCGPTTVAMIAASYLGNNFNPKTIVDTYKSKGYLLGCVGSRYSDAKQVLQGLGLKTTDYLIFNAEKADTVVPELRKYLNAGWTFFTLASFCSGGCGHFFWITAIDAQGNIFAYDSAYGQYQIPYNENSRYPYPLYRLAFGVKR